MTFLKKKKTLTELPKLIHKKAQSSREILEYLKKPGTTNRGFI